MATTRGSALDDPAYPLEIAARRSGIPQGRLRALMENGVTPARGTTPSGALGFTAGDLERARRATTVEDAVSLSPTELRDFLDEEDIVARTTAALELAGDDPAVRRAVVRGAIAALEQQRELIGRRVEALSALDTQLLERLAQLRELPGPTPPSTQPGQ